MGQRSPNTNLAPLFTVEPGIIDISTPSLDIVAVQVHLPGYVEDYEKLKAKGVEVVACIAVNDVFVMSDVLRFDSDSCR